jgi:outer membrane beta-barrel protein
MTRRCTTIGSCLLVLAFCSPAMAQEAEGTQGKDEAVEGGPPADEGTAEAPGEPAPTDEAVTPTAKDVAPTTPLLTTDAKISAEDRWKDIVVLPRKTFLKNGRIELMPFFGTTMSDNLIQHYALGGEVNYFLSDVLSIGVSGMYYFKNVLDDEFYTRYHFKRIPSLNQYIYTVTANFAYVPFYGKFSLFNKKIMHFEVYFMGGVGGSGTKVIPRDYDMEPFTNAFSLTFPVGLGGRFFINRWMTVNFSFRDLIMLDKYEPVNRPKEPELAKENADSRILLFNMMFNVGVSFFFPTNFKYTTFR